MEKVAGTVLHVRDIARPYGNGHHHDIGGGKTRNGDRAQQLLFSVGLFKPLMTHFVRAPFIAQKIKLAQNGFQPDRVFGSLNGQPVIGIVERNSV